ncbi:uncharacterized protein B0H18DRAFT_1050160 [Fomitopsis serialis]|uniref:uncharacterized protein n=1 Tax=Fomitopsis serialis TaxID=139415 RepID=UPI0020080696|nr:uncharacterized protein B0H18DRAFT_1050160 [Neoantrodia serialis]KAH9913234.1 hypothetical protein B0H18DRAFT_1050160 [Neoantrodia serialis]
MHSGESSSTTLTAEYPSEQPAPTSPVQQPAPSKRPRPPVAGDRTEPESKRLGPSSGARANPGDRSAVKAVTRGAALAARRAHLVALGRDLEACQEDIAQTNERLARCEVQLSETVTPRGDADAELADVRALIGEGQVLLADMTAERDKLAQEAATDVIQALHDKIALERLRQVRAAQAVTVGKHIGVLLWSGCSQSLLVPLHDRPPIDFNRLASTQAEVDRRPVAERNIQSEHDQGCVLMNADHERRAVMCERFAREMWDLMDERLDELPPLPAAGGAHAALAAGG